MSLVREAWDTEESGASSIEDGREESDEETAPKVINKLKSDEVGSSQKVSPTQSNEGKIKPCKDC